MKLLVEKRNNSLVPFEIKKITDAISKAFTSEKVPLDNDVLELLGLRVFSTIQSDFVENKINVETIQDAVEHVLIQSGFTKVAKSYVLYRKQHEKARDAVTTYIDYKKAVNEYLNLKDWRVNENATVTYSVGGLILSNSATISANYWLTEVYDEEISKLHQDGSMHIHDLSMLTGYCAGWSLKQLIYEGLGGVEGKITSKPAKHLQTLCNQMVNFLGIMQNEWAGAQAFSSFDTYLAPFVRIDKLSYEQVKKSLESFIFGVNTPSRWGTQAPFTNITIDWVCPDDLKDQPALVGGEYQDFNYGELQEEMNIINKAFLEIMIKGDANGRGFQYPIPTYSITKDFDWSETENNRLLFEMTAKYGTPYFSNYVNSDMSPSDVRSMCCRLRLDLRELRKKSGGYFGSGESTGSIGVVTINLPRIAYLANDTDDFYQRLEYIMDKAAKSLKTKRIVINQFMENGLYPYTKKYLGTFKNHFSTLGVIGMNEACLNAKWISNDLSEKKCQDFAIEVLLYMRKKLSDYQEKYNDLYNLEATPAESTTYRFAKKDKELFPNIITAGINDLNPYYTNSSHLPVNYTEDVFKALNIQDKLQVLYTSGTVFHVFLGERMPDWLTTSKLVKAIADNYKLPYYTISPTYSVCTTHGYLNGVYEKCPICNEEVEIYSRITGYYRPIKNWNLGKKTEYKNRINYKQ
ncbi:MAG: ribonucleoside triphosphate reductase [Candidatus Izemoplasmatales bacterium]